MVDELPCLFLAALDIEGEDRTTAVREELLVKFMVWMRRNGWVINLSHLRIVLQIFYHLQCILNVTLYTEAQCLQALKKNPGIEWRDGCTGITKDDRTDSGYEGCCSGYICEYGTMIRWVWLSESRELVGICLPVELTAIYDDTTER